MIISCRCCFDEIVFFSANGVRAAVPLSGGGGRLGIVELPIGASPRARAPPTHPAGTHPPALLHPAPLQDWTWDPFRDDRLIVACDDGVVREWIIPENGEFKSRWNGKWDILLFIY